MNRTTNASVRVALLRLAAATLTLALAPAALAGDFAIDSWTVDGGGEMFSTGGDFSLGGTIGQADAGVMTGGDFELQGGFWAVAAAPCDPCDTDCDGMVNAFDIEPPPPRVIWVISIKLFLFTRLRLFRPVFRAPC